MPIGMFDFYTRPKPPSSEELATAYKRYIETCIAAFGANGAMFESNFPPDGASSSSNPVECPQTASGRIFAI